MGSTYEKSVALSSCMDQTSFVEEDFCFGCPGSDCAGSQCPGVFFEGTDWTRSFGEVFQIFHPAGPGRILNGDFVGLYFLCDNKWFSMWHGRGHEQDCPGKASTDFSFQDMMRWLHCS